MALREKAQLSCQVAPGSQFCTPVCSQLGVGNLAAGRGVSKPGNATANKDHNVSLPEVLGCIETLPK